MTFTFGQFVWYKGEGWQYLGMDEDGVQHLMRPVQGHAFGVVEFEQVYTEELDEFFKENGEQVGQKRKRKTKEAR